MSTSEHSEYSKNPDLNKSREARPSDEPNAQPSGDSTQPGNRDTSPATPSGYDNIIHRYEPERRVRQGGESESPDLAEVLAETDTLGETTYPDVTGTIQDTEWVGQGGELDNTVQESRVGLDRLGGQQDAPDAPAEEDNVTGADSVGDL
ncbi:MAG: hypothetical protein ACXWQR_14125 [Ktedonobacterales bacterium]